MDVPDHVQIENVHWLRETLQRAQRELWENSPASELCFPAVKEPQSGANWKLEEWRGAYSSVCLHSWWLRPEGSIPERFSPLLEHYGLKAGGHILGQNSHSYLQERMQQEQSEWNYQSNSYQILHRLSKHRSGFWLTQTKPFLQELPALPCSILPLKIIGDQPPIT